MARRTRTPCPPPPTMAQIRERNRIEFDAIAARAVPRTTPPVSIDSHTASIIAEERRYADERVGRRISG